MMTEQVYVRVLNKFQVNSEWRTSVYSSIIIVGNILLLDILLFFMQ